MIRIAHESPICTFEQVQKWTDIDYALVHLFEESMEYYNDFRKAVLAGREVILDNSIFELGEAFDADQYKGWIAELSPTWYIIPDVLGDADATINNAAKWFIQDGAALPGKRIAVVQGKTYFEFVKCYNTFNADPLIDMIAFAFNYKFFEDWYPDEPTVYHQWTKGRIELMRRITSDKVVNPSKRHHLLGCGLPQEGKLGGYANKYPWVYSTDTSNPIVHGLKGVHYDSYYGLENKESTKLFTLINSEVSDYQLALMEWNTKKFREFWTGEHHAPF